MMDCLVTTTETEKKALKILIPWIKERYKNAIFINIKELQENYGDIIVNTDDGNKIIEIKAEEENKYNNFFFETWSNRKWQNLGWASKMKRGEIKADYLFYFFIKERELYIFTVPELIKWLFDEKNIYAFDEKEQGKHKQKNDTWGHTVPIDKILEAKKIKVKKYTLESVEV